MKKTKQVTAPAPSGKIAKRRASRSKINSIPPDDFETEGDVRTPREPEAHSKSVGLHTELRLAEQLSPYVKRGFGFHYFLSRRFMLADSALAYVFSPGGFGTRDELLTVTTPIQTGKAARDVPVR